MNRSSFLAAVCSLLASALVAGDAGAYYGAVTRNMCPSAALSTFLSNGYTHFGPGHWVPDGTSLCILAVEDATITSQAEGWVSIPDTSVSAADVTMVFSVHGSEMGTEAWTCVQSFVFDVDGSVLSNSGDPQCTDGGSVSAQVLTTTVDAVPVGGAVSTQVRGGTSSTLDMISQQWNVAVL